MNLWLIFLTGLTSGGVSCAAMQGGLLAATIANNKTRELETNDAKTKVKSFDINDWGPVSIFLTVKLIAHIILGFVLGALGSAVTLSLSARLFFQGITAIYMLATAANLLSLHPIFRYLAFTPPRFVGRFIKTKSSSNALFAPAILGAITIFIPCGVTQAIALLAITSGNSLQGGLIMGAFIAGTLPIFILIGLATAKFSEIWRIYFLRFAAIILVGMALYSLNGILEVLNNPFATSRLAPTIVKLLPPYDKTTPPKSDSLVIQVDGVQKVHISISNNGYSPKRFVVKAGVPVELTLTTNDVYSCASSFTFNAFGINDVLKPTDQRVHTFTPTKKGSYTFACSMGMYVGTMEVI